MMAEVEVQTERADDIPLLITQQQEMGIPEILDRVIKRHGNRQGLSIGWTTTGWLTYILSESDHRLSFVEPWAARREETLSRLLPGKVTANDFTDDRLGDILCELSHDAQWTAIEQALGQRLLQVYPLPDDEPVRLDSTSAAVYHHTEGTELFRHGHSKDHRPDLAQLKAMLATLDPMGLPLATLVVPGNVADDGLYIPVIDQARQVLNQRSLLYIGDSKMESLATRAHLVAGNDHYMVPLSSKGEQAQLLQSLLAPVLDGQQALTDVYRQQPESQEKELIGQGYETSRPQEAMVDGNKVHWRERVLVIYSAKLAQSAYRGLRRRLQKAEEKLLALTPEPGRGKRQYRALEPLQTEVEAILTRHRVTGLLQVTYQRQVRQRYIRKYKERPARMEEQVRYQIGVTPNEAAVKALYRTLGWRLFVTNAPPERLPLPAAVLAYRGSPRVERNFSRLKGRPLGLRPFFLRREDHVKGLTRLLSLALRVLTLPEFIVRRTLQATGQKLSGLYPGNPKQTTERPTTERLLAAFKEINLTIVRMPNRVIYHITPLTDLQRRILALLGLPPSIYAGLASPVEPIPP
jgi:transposase